MVMKGRVARRVDDPDVHPVPGVKPFRFDYSVLPPRFFAHIPDSVLQAHRNRRLDRVPPTE